MSRTESEVQGKASQYSFFITRKERGKGIGILDGTLKRELASLPLGTVLYRIGIACIASALPLPLPARYPAVTLRLGLCKLINGTYLLHMPTPRFNFRSSNHNGCVLKVLLNLVIMMLTASGVQG